MGATQDIRAKLKEIVDNLTGNGKPFMQSFDYYETQPNQFPSVMVIFTRPTQPIRLDNVSNEYVARFVIRVVTPEKNGKPQEDLKISWVDALQEEFHKASNVDTLGGVVQKLDIESIETFYSNDTDQPLTGFDFVIAASKIVSIIN